MPGVPPVSQESWKQVQQNIDIMQSGRIRKKRHKLSIPKLCSCMVAQPPDDFPESSRPYEKRSLNSVGETPAIEQAIISQAAQKTQLDATSEEEEPAQDIEMPPPMEIQEHSFKPESKEVSTDDVTAKLASQLSLKPQGEATTSVDLAFEIDNMVKNRIDPSLEMTADRMIKTADQELSHLDIESTKEDEDEDDKADNEGKDMEAEKAKYLKKRQYVVQELFDTEKDYVKDLASIIDGYMAHMKENPLPGEMDGKDKIVFGNIHQIYDWHNETMLTELERCLTDASRVASIFIRYERRLYMYVKYCENKPKSEYVVSEYLDTYFEEVRQKLGHRLMLPDLLIKPVQRIMRYQLLLKDILKYTEKAEADTAELKQALRVMCVVPKAANDMMQVGRLQGFDGKITAQGKLLLQDTLLVSESSSGNQQKFKERRVFLFEQIVIFSEMIERKKGNFSNATYIYKNSLKVNKMSLVDKVEGEPLRFQLNDKTPGSDVRMIIQANSEENKDTWIRQIRSILDMQGNFLRALQSPIAYQKELIKELSAPEFNSNSGESSLRKTQSHPLNRAHNLSPSKLVAAKSLTESSSVGSKYKSDRCKSVPGPFPQSLVELSLSGGREYSVGKASCPNSPLETSKDFLRGNSSDGSLRKFSSPAVDATSGSCSPKPKRNIFEGFRNTLGRKSKSSDSAAGAGRSTADTAVTSLPQSPSSMTGGVDAFTVFPAEGGSSEARINEPSDETAAAAAGASMSTSINMSVSLNSSTSSSDRHPETPLTSGRILFDYQAVREDEVTVSKGELVQILNTNHQNMYLIHRPANQTSPAAEGWVPSHIIGPRDGDGSLRKSSKQMFKIKKPMFRSPQRSDMDGKEKKEKDIDGMNSLERKSKSLGRDGKPKVKFSASELGFDLPPIIQQPLTSLTVQAGDVVTLTCKICGRPRPLVSWRYQDLQVIGPSSRVMMLYNEEGQATLQLSNVTAADSGEYSCVASSELGTVVTRATLTVLVRPGPPGQPVIRNQVGTAVHLEWAPPVNAQTTPTMGSGIPVQIQGYTIEFREAGSTMWQLAIPYVPNTSQVIGELEPGLTYQFRVSANNAIGISEPSKPSPYVAIPSEYELSEREDAPCVMWKATFENDFTDIGEIGKGRFAVVHRCIQKCSGQDLACKLITKRLIRKEAAEIEFNTIQSLQHVHLVKVFDLYETPSHYVIIMELLTQGRLLEYICSKHHFDELMAAEYLGQLLDCLHYLHNCRIAHLDIKPENLMIEAAPTAVYLKLIDFGDARHIYNNYYIHPMIGHPEFTSPEVVSGTPVGLSTDIWSVGVLLYVLLSGVSPFLDESQEETCSNIVRNDFCFPDEYFAGISPEAKELVRFMLVEELNKRPTAQACLESPWIKKAAVPRSSPIRPKPINTSRLSDFIQRRKHQSDAFILKSLP